MDDTATKAGPNGGVSGVQAIYLFGSRALAKEHALSDYDYAVLTDTPHHKGDVLYMKLYDVFAGISPRGVENNVIDARLSKLSRLALKEFSAGDNYDLAQHHLRLALEGVFHISSHILSRLPGARTVEYKEIARQTLTSPTPSWRW